jgi:hypothetical protein
MKKTNMTLTKDVNAKHSDDPLQANYEVQQMFQRLQGRQYNKSHAAEDNPLFHF